MTSVRPLSDADLAGFIARNQVAARLVYPGVPTPTVPAAAAALGVETDQILKSLVFVLETSAGAEGDPGARLVVAAGEARVDYRRLAGLLGLSRRKVRLADPAEALALTGFEVGAMPPFGHLQGLPTLVDSRTVRHGRTYFGGGGTRAALLEITVETLVSVTGAELLPLTRERE